jgi:nucleotide-binding universal stress UspA family protein
MTVYSQVIVGTDGSRTASEAVLRAAAWAARLEIPLLVVSAWLRPHEGDFGPPSERASSPKEALETTAYRAALETVQDAAALVHGVFPGLSLDTATPEGDPADMLIEEAERRVDALLAVGSQGMTGSQRFLLGSVPNKVSHHAPGDVVILQTGEGDSDVAPARVLLTTDGSATAARAVRRGAQIAAALGAEATVLTVDDHADRAEASLKDAHQIVVEQGAKVQTERRSGNPAEVIVAVGAEHDLIVVGNRGMTGTGRFLLGQVPNKVSHHSTTDLLIVKTDR